MTRLTLQRIVIIIALLLAIAAGVGLALNREPPGEDEVAVVWRGEPIFVRSIPDGWSLAGRAFPHEGPTSLTCVAHVIMLSPCPL